MWFDMIPTPTPLEKKRDCEYINQKENDDWEALRHADKMFHTTGRYLCMPAQQS